MREEPFGSVAVVSPFRGNEERPARAERPALRSCLLHLHQLAGTDRHGSGSSSGRHGEHQTFGLALPVSTFGGVRYSGHGGERRTGSIHPGVRPSRALHRSRTPRWRRARARCLQVSGAAHAGSRVSSPGDHPARGSAPRRDRAHANPGAQAGAGSPACASSSITAATWPCGSDGSARKAELPRSAWPRSDRNDPARLFYMATLNG